MALKKIFEPIQIGNVTVKNRVVRSAHGTNIGGGELNDELIAYHVARARGGVGLTCLEFCSPHPSSTGIALRNYDDSIIDGYRKIVAAVKPYGMTLFQQLAHGGVMYPALDGVAWSASATPNPLSGAVPIEMSRDQIEEITQAFVNAAARCIEGGIQGLEVHFGHGYLLHQFLSPLMNRRSDEYGGSLENRMRFGREILRRIRAIAPAGFPIGIRCSDNHAPGGNSPDEAAQTVAILEGEGLLDFVTSSQGSYYCLPDMLPAMDRPVGSMLPSSTPIAAGATRAVRIVTPARVRTLEEADQMLREDIGDMIVMQRAHIADPEIVIKTQEGREEEIRPCIGCNQGCVGGLLSYAMRLGCAVNPAVGNELTLDEAHIAKTTAPKKVLVVGGGPGGMEAARIAALAGHEVVLAEAMNSLGGAINVAQLAPRLYSIGDFTSWQEREVYRLGVDVRLSTYMEADDIHAEGADVVIMATGSMPRMDGVQHAVPGLPTVGVEQPHVVSATDLLLDSSLKLGKTALVFDDVGGYESIAAAEYLIEQGVAVTFATRFGMMTPKVESWCRTEPALERLQKGDFTLLLRQHLVSVGKDTAVLRPLQSVKETTVDADLVVLVLSRTSLSEVYDEIRSNQAQISVIGDARAPRDFMAAVHEGHRAARAALVDA